MKEHKGKPIIEKINGKLYLKHERNKEKHVKKIFKGLEEDKEICTNEKEENTCEDLPVTYCQKCRTFYVVLEDGTRVEIMGNREEINF